MSDHGQSAESIHHDHDQRRELTMTMPAAHARVDAPTPLRRVSMLLHPRSQEAAELGERTERRLRSAGVHVQRVHRQAGKDQSLDPDTDLMIAIGGDGTVLRAQRLAVPCRVPVLGIGAGRLGFLAELTPEELDRGLSRILSGECNVEHRTLLEVAHHREGVRVALHSALNDAVLARGRVPRSLWIDVWIDGAQMHQYVADGVIAATATGSTAYSLAAGGPILAPELPSIILTPIAAHLSFVQSIVLAEHTHIKLSLVRSQDALLSVDGQADAPVIFGDTLNITTSTETARFLRLQPPGQFYTQLVHRLQRKDDRS